MDQSGSVNRCRVTGFDGLANVRKRFFSAVKSRSGFEEASPSGLKPPTKRGSPFCLLVEIRIVEERWESAILPILSPTHAPK